MIQCLLVDDEPLALDLLADYASKVPFLNLKKATTSPIEALTLAQEGDVDLVFLDVQMPELTGIQFMKIARGKVKVILTTAYPEYALDGYEHDVVDYLLKPFSFERFMKAVQKAQAALQAPTEKEGVKTAAEDFIFVKTEHKIQKVDLDEILFIEGLKDYISIFTPGGRVVTLSTMKKMEDMLPGGNFVRVHKSYIVALDKIESIERSRISIGDKVVPIGDTYRDPFFQLIGGRNLG
ncbi:MAG: response regulator transcription factor [Mucilaginibacter polytrichastri]|nr:response regulator transcription factor [Mucilaginibacter polytrichastri]